MTAYYDRPKWSVPIEARCEAIAKPVKQDWRQWVKIERRCQRPANQGRDG